MAPSPQQSDSRCRIQRHPLARGARLPRPAVDEQLSGAVTRRARIPLRRSRPREKGTQRRAEFRWAGLARLAQRHPPARAARLPRPAAGERGALGAAAAPALNAASFAAVGRQERIWPHRVPRHPPAHTAPRSAFCWRLSPRLRDRARRAAASIVIRVYAQRGSRGRRRRRRSWCVSRNPAGRSALPRRENPAAQLGPGGRRTPDKQRSGGRHSAAPSPQRRDSRCRIQRNPPARAARLPARPPANSSAAL